MSSIADKSACISAVICSGLIKNLNNTQFIEMLYRSMLGRPADPGGLAAAVAELDRGTSRQVVFANYVNSIEFDLICQEHGIVRGTYIP